LQDLLKHTRPGHPDFANLTKATQRMCDVAQMVDERNKQAELLNHMFQIQNETKGARARLSPQLLCAYH
jgi:hypothetical protein